MSGEKSQETYRLGVAAVFSVLFVTGVWFSFSRGLESLTTVEVPIQYMNRNSAVAILATSQNTARLDLSGSGALIRSVQPGQIQVRLDLGKAQVGENNLVITPDNISLPPGVYLKRIEQPEVSVTLGLLDVPTQKEVPVQVRWTGQLPKNMILTEAILYPAKVQVIGGSRVLKDVSTIYTEPVSLENIKESGTLTTALVLDPLSLKIATGSKDRVTVAFVITERK